MQKKKRRTSLSSRQKILLLISVLMLLASGICFFLCWRLSRMLTAQQEAERWQGEGDMPYKQISCFLPMDQQITLEQIATFRKAAMSRLKEGSLDISGEEILMQDCWSTTGTVNVSGRHGKGEASVIAVGGNYFDFHPIRLLDGDYLHPEDLMEDRVLLDVELSWLLFGGTSLQGQEVRLNGIPYVVAGVIERESDFASRKAYTSGMGLYVSYEGLQKLYEDTDIKINCYEYVMANPVKNFALNLAKEKFPIGRGEIVCNTDRYQFGHLTDIILQYGARSTQSTGVLFPYWENAARITEDWAALFLLLGMVLPIFPVILGISVATRAYKSGKTKMEEEILPEMREKAGEAVRVRQRKRWERKHGAHEKSD